ncbi:MAG: hypothetical protein AAGC55_29850, partial [Myxococcota bacterium]
RGRGTTVLLSAHQMSLVEKVADRVVLLSRGRVVLSGSMDELQQQHDAGDVYDVTTTRPVDATADLAALGALADVLSVEQTGDMALRLVLASGRPLGPVLAAWDLSAVAELSRERHTLHDLYVQAVSEDRPERDSDDDDRGNRRGRGADTTSRAAGSGASGTDDDSDRGGVGALRQRGQEQAA